MLSVYTYGNDKPRYYCKDCWREWYRNGSRVEYGKQIVVSVSRQLVAECGDSFEEKNLRRRNI